MKRKNWTEAETTYLMENYPAISDTAMAARLGVSRRTLSNKAHELGLDKGINPEWLERAEKVRGLYSSRSYTEIALETGIPLRSVARIISKLGLNRSKREENRIRSRIRRNITDREKRRVIFGLAPLTRIKVVTNKRRIKLRHALKKAGYIVQRGQNVMYYHTEMERDHRRENAGRSVGLSFEPWETIDNKLCVTL